MYILRKSKLDDVPEMVRIAEAGRNRLKRLGIDQWQKGAYPAEKDFVSDIEKGIGYVLTDDDKPIAICAVSFDGDKAYDIIDGAWLTPDKAYYAVVHRGAVAPEYQGKGVAVKLLEEIFLLAREMGCISVRLDTHEENGTMRGVFERAGFSYCGVVHLYGGDCDGDPRVAYERIL